jgi:hypothetical protein
MAAEMYLASVMLVDDQQDAERAYLDELASALQLDPTLQLHLEQQAKEAPELRCLRASLSRTDAHIAFFISAMSRTTWSAE